MDVEATTAVRQAEVTAQRRMIERTQERFGIWPERLAADTGYGSTENLAWLVHERGIEPHIPVFDKDRTDDVRCCQSCISAIPHIALISLTTWCLTLRVHG
jgi:hypothetical protein